MAIEFPCPHCTQLLRVADESAGKTAKCPKCSGLAKIPGGDAGINFAPPGGAPLGAPLPSNYGAPSGNFGGSAPAKNPFSDSGAANPYSSQPKFGAPDININPYASPTGGYQQSADAFAPNLPVTHQIVGVEPILNYSMQIWQNNLGLLIGVTLVAGIITQVVNYFFQFLQTALQQNKEPEMALTVAIIAFFVTNAVQIFFATGTKIVVLKLCRRQPAQFTDLFSGAPLFIAAVVVTFLFSMAIGVAVLLLIVPAIILALMWWPAFSLVVDKKAGIIESFSVAATITKDNWGTTFLLWLLTIGIILLGCLAVCVGLIFAAPLVATLWGTAYLMMAGQIPVNPALGQYKPTPQPAPQWPTS